MRFLVIDTSAGCALGLVEGDSEVAELNVLAEVYSTDARAHAEQLSLLLAKTVRQAGFKNLAAAGVDYIAVGRGPAPFTGLRAGLMVAKTLGYALDLPVVGVCSLAVLARGVFTTGDIPEKTVLVTADARRKELYGAAYKIDAGGALVEVSAPAVDKPAVFAEMAEKNGWLVAGVGPRLYPDQITGLTDAGTVVQVRDLAQLAVGSLQARDVSPLYLRRPDIHRGA